MEETKYDLTIERLNASYIRITSDEIGVLQDIYDTFTYKEPTFTKNKYTKWDGTTRLFKKKDQTLPYGCLQMLGTMIKDRKWKADFDTRFKQDFTNVTKAELIEWTKTLDIRSDGIPIEPYDYQIEALYLSIKFNRMVLLAATSAGKSLIAYMLTRYYEMIASNQSEKTLILVPSQMLVDQMFDDFKDYSSHNGWSVDRNCHKIMEGMAKTSRKPVFISTWQSIYEQPPDYFEGFSSIINDETHLASGKSISTIMNNSINAHRRVGMTGTLKNDKLHPILVMSLFGPIQRVVSTRELIDAGRATEVSVTGMMLMYDEAERALMKGASYQDEIEFLINHTHRNKIISTLIASLKGNTLAIFDRLEHIETIERLLGQINHGKQVFVITGDVKRDERAIIKEIASREDGVIVLGTFGCVSTGLSIKRLRNLVFGHPSKSIIRILQSIGRILRLHEEKNYAFVFDCMDDLSSGPDVNHTLRHAFERVEMYKYDKLPMAFKKFIMKLTGK
jgi:superfamily II DNA or RNA helicase